MITVTLKGGEKREFPEHNESAPITAFDVAKSIGAGLAKAACAARIATADSSLDGEICDLRKMIDRDCTLDILTFDTDDGRKAFRHTAAHILAQAVKKLYPDAKLAIGPAIEDGFYYDFDIEKPFTQEDLEKIEAEMKQIVKADLKLEAFTLSSEEALKFFEEQNEPYKIELCQELTDKGAEVSFYRQGNFTDLCAGPHLMSTGTVKAFKLLNCTGAYWRGNEKNKMLSRIYGTAFPKASQLETHLARLEEAKKRDHRKLGKELSLFMLTDEGIGFPFFMPNGMILRNLLIDYWRELHTEAGYKEVSTPAMLTRDLWERSGHWAHYSQNIYTSEIDGANYAIKPMNCPGGILVYMSSPHSYREFPLRIGELGLVHRHEKSGALHGLMRVRCFTQDDAHIFMTKEQIKDEIKNVTKLIDEVYSGFGFNYHIELSTMPEDHMGSEEDWEIATNALENALKEIGRDYIINQGDGAFYGPKIDFHLEDSIGRTWQCGTIQLDFQLPERFELEYIGTDGAKHRPVMIHRVVFGSIERFIAILIEHFAGAFPLWLAPEQVRIMPIADRHNEFCEKVLKKLKFYSIRADIDSRSEKVGFKIREAQLQKIPYMLIIGDNEVETEQVSVRSRKEGDLGAIKIDALCEKLNSEIIEKAL
ncbi:MAG: threonine--tRNA ligase [Oscillospiraceae bacterium]|nr:threonine--tRNA ligase [Oscillospiraceae bacterium]